MHNVGIAAFTRAVAKRARRGLYAGRQVLFGNNVSEDGGNRCEEVTLNIVPNPLM
jgi:hypothetical protein